MYRLKLIYNEGTGEKSTTDLNIKFRFPSAITSSYKNLIKDKMNYYKNFVNGNATIKEYLEKNEGFKQDDAHKNIFLKDIPLTNLAILTIRKPFLTLGLDINVHTIDKASLEEILNPIKLNSFLEEKK